VSYILGRFVHCNLREDDITYLRKVICEIPKLAQAVKCLNDQQDVMPVAVKCVIGA
jgi:hypothetical protein